jgi:hypothetical protein
LFGDPEGVELAEADELPGIPPRNGIWFSILAEADELPGMNWLKVTRSQAWSASFCRNKSFLGISDTLVF